MFFVTVALLLIFAGLSYVYLIWNFDYWKKRGVAGPKPSPFMGNLPSGLTQKRHMVYDINEHYQAYKKDHDFVGIFNWRSPQLLVTSPALAHRVFVNDFKHFHDNELTQMMDEKSDFILANNPFTLSGEKWKERRAEVTPGLTISRIKSVFPVTTRICKVMSDYMKEQIRATPKDGLEAKEIALRFTSQVVTDCVLGLNAESFSPKPTPIYGMIQKLFHSSFAIIFYFLTVTLFPVLKKFYKARFIPKDMEKFFVDLMQNAINARRAMKEPGERTDFLNYLLQLQDKHQYSTLELTARTMTFLLDGYETTAAVLSNTLLFLGRNRESQQKLRAEILESFGESGDVDFDKLMELPYLDACIHEAIRIFPPALFSNKLCTEPIELTDRDGTVLKLKKDDVVCLPLHAIMIDEDYYPNPQEFQPERFLPENGGVKKYRDQGLFLGFADGPRICLGMRFALTQIKAALVEIMREFDVKVNPKTRTDNLLDPKYFLVRLEGGTWLDFDKRH